MNNRSKQVVIKALTAILRHLNNPNHTHEFSAKWLQTNGIRTNSKLGRYIRSHALIEIGTGYTPGLRSKQYRLNESGIIDLAKAVGIDLDEIKITGYQEKYNEVLTHGFDESLYEEKSDRLWNGVQFIKKDIKQRLMSRNGYMHDYDIQCCHPSLLYQYAKQLDESLVCPNIERMLSDRKLYRQELSFATGIDRSKIKDIINSLFNSGKLGVNYRFGLYRDILNCNDRDTLALMANDEIIELRKDILKMWQVIKSHRGIDLRSGKQKSSIARELEKTVLDSAIRFLRKTNNKFLPEHDGWKCQYEIDEYQLIKSIKERTGYTIKLDHTDHHPYVSDPAQSAASAESLIPSSAIATSDINSQQTSSTKNDYSFVSNTYERTETDRETDTQSIITGCSLVLFIL